MNIAFMGAHGTGKTTSLYALKNKLSDNTYIIPDQYRLIAKTLHYNNPREIIIEKGQSQRSYNMSAFVATALGGLSQLEFSSASYNLADLDPLTYYAYYLYWINKDATERNIPPISLPFIKKLTEYYSQQFQIHFYFPINIIPLKSDDMRSNDQVFQSEIDYYLHNCLDEFKVKNLKIIQSDSIEERYDEMQDWIKHC